MTEREKELEILLKAAEDGRRRAEIELGRALEKFSKDIEYVSRLRTERCGTFRKRETKSIIREEHPLLDGSQEGHSIPGDWIVFTASDEAKLAGIARSDSYLIDAYRWHSLPGEVVAESWWHVCAQTGLTEFLARVLYEAVE